MVGTSTRSNFAWGLGLIASSQCRVEGVYIAKTFAAGLMLASSGILTAFERGMFNTKDVFDVTIVGNQVHRAGTYFPVIPTNGNHYGIEISSGSDIIAADNNVTSSNSRGITIADNKTKRVSLSDNNVKYSGSTGIYAGSVKGVTVNGNTLTMNKAQGLALIGAKDVIANNNIVQNNNFWDKDSEVTTLSASINATLTSLKFASGVNFAIFAVPFSIVIDLEQMSVTAFNSITGNATVTRARNGTAAAPHAAGAIITSGPRTVSIDNALIQNCTNIVFEGNQSLEDWSVALYPDTNIHNANKAPAIKNRVERAVEFTGNNRFRVSGNLCYCGSGTVTGVYFGTPNTNTDGLRDDYKGTAIPTETAFRAGQTYYKTDTDVGYVYNGSLWKGVKYNL